MVTHCGCLNIALSSVHRTNYNVSFLGGGGGGGPPGGDDKNKKNPAPTPRSAKRRKKKGPSGAVKIPQVFPNSKCKLRLLKLERIKDFLLMEEEYISNQELLRPREEKMESERAKVDDLRGTPMSVGTLEEIIDDNHAIVSSSMGPEYYVTIMSFVNQDLLEPGSSVLLHNRVTYAFFPRIFIP